jgi:hypothetical protein
LFLVPVLFSSLFVQQNLNQDSFCPGWDLNHEVFLVN